MPEETQNSTESLGALSGGTVNPKTPEEQAASLFGTPPAVEAAKPPVATPVPPVPPTPPVEEPPKGAGAASIPDLEKAVTEAKTPEEKTAAEKALADAKTAATADAPITLEALKVPEGLTIPEAEGKEFLEVLNDKALKPADRAQKLIDLQAKVLQQAAEGRTQAWKAVQEEWQAEADKDAEIGGEKLDPALGEISKSIDTFTKSPEEAATLRNLFAITGFGNNIHAIKYLHRLATAAQVSEGRPAVGAAQDPRTGKTAAQVMYPNQP